MWRATSRPTPTEPPGRGRSAWRCRPLRRRNADPRTPPLLRPLGALDIPRCGLLLGSLHSSPGVPLIVAGLAATAACLLGARSYRRRQHWSAATALLIGVATAPQAAAAGFRAPFTIPDL